MPKKKPAKNQMLKKSVNMISIKYTNTQKVMNIKKKKEKVESVTVPKLFKTPEFQNGMFFSNLLGLSFSCTVKQMVESVF